MTTEPTNLRILFDYNNLACRCAHVSRTKPDLLPYMIFNVMREFVEGVSDILDAGDTIDVVLALDSHDGYWRREIYPPYKADRQEKRRDDGFDWEAAFAEFDTLADAVGRFTPWRIVRASKCEADDVIYTLSAEHRGPVVIHSGDSDYLQLVNDHVSLYLPHLQEYVEFPRYCKVSGTDVYCETPEDYLRYAILTGQGGKDNVFNVKTPTDFSGTRKPGLGAVAAKKILETGDFEAELLRLGLHDNYMRNRKLIDMRELPDEYRQMIIAANAAAGSNDPDLAGLLAIYDWPSVARDALTLEAWFCSLRDGIVKNCEEEEFLESVDFQL